MLKWLKKKIEIGIFKYIVDVIRFKFYLPIAEMRNYIFYKRNGLKGIRSRSLEELNHDPQKGIKYQTLHYWKVCKILKRTKSADVTSFLDAGCGPGLILFLASLAGYKKLYGFDLSDILISEAKENHRRAFNYSVDLEVCEAQNYKKEIEGKYTLFLFNPFNPALMNDFLSGPSSRKLERIIYWNPIRLEQISSNFPDWIEENIFFNNMGLYRERVTILSKKK